MILPANPRPRRPRLLPICVFLLVAGQAPVSADDSTEAAISSVCANVAAGGTLSLAAADATINLSDGTLANEVQALANLEGELKSKQRNRDEYAEKIAQMGGSAQAGAPFIRRDAEAAKQAWRNQYQAPLGALRTAHAQAIASVASISQDIASTQQELDAENNKPWLGRSSSVIARLEQKIVALNGQLPAAKQAQADGLRDLNEKVAELKSLTDAEDRSAQEKIAANTAQFNLIKGRYDSYKQDVTVFTDSLRKRQGELGKRQFALNEARNCVKTARNPTKASPPTASPSPGGSPPYDPRTDAGDGGKKSPGDSAAASNAGSEFEGGVPNTGRGRGGPAVVATQGPNYQGVPPPPPGGPLPPGLGGTMPYGPMIAGAGVLGYPVPPTLGNRVPLTTGGTVTGPTGPNTPPPPPPTTGTKVPSKPATPTTPAVPPVAAAGGECRKPTCSRDGQTDCESVPIGTDWTAACYANMLSRCNQGMAGATGATCVHRGADPSCEVRAKRVCAGG